MSTYDQQIQMGRHTQDIFCKIKEELNLQSHIYMIQTVLDIEEK
jgi:hypothetical protein